MDSACILIRTTVPLVAILSGVLPACATGPLVAREVLSDPLMRFSPGPAIGTPNEPAVQADALLPPDTVVTRFQFLAEPGKAVQGTSTDTSFHAAVELVSGLALEAGYGLRTENQLVQKLDGFLGAVSDDRLRQGPDAALVLDDGTSLLRIGYRYRTAWDGPSHEPSVLARTTVLRQDTIVEVGYQRRIRSLLTSAEHLPARDPVDDQIKADVFTAAIEQGFVPGWNVRLDFAGLLESGFLQSPYRLVSLWSLRGEETAGEFSGVPQVEPERHPASRARWGALLRVRKMLPALSGALEVGGGHGTDSWRVEQTQVGVSYLQRLGDSLIVSLAGGGYHQTRATFYRDEYTKGPPGAYWSADRGLCSYLAWWVEVAPRMTWIPERGRLLGMFKYFSLLGGGRLSKAYTNWEGLDSPNGFTAFGSLAGGTRDSFAGGLVLSGWLGMEGGF